MRRLQRAASLHGAGFHFAGEAALWPRTRDMKRACARQAGFRRPKLSKVPLKADHSHDVKAMVAADPNAGVLYICNPNNPTGTITPKEDIVWALENKPKGSILLGGRGLHPSLRCG
jgi:hypothetical protein